MHKLKFPALALLSLALAACAVGPDHVRPNIALPGQYARVQAPEQAGDPDVALRESDAEFWRGFHHAQSKIIFLDKHAGRAAANRARFRLMASSCANVLVRTVLLSPKHLARAWGRLRGVWQLRLGGTSVSPL